MNILEYVNMLAVTKGLQISPECVYRVVELCEKYFTHNELELSFSEVINYYIYYTNTSTEYLPDSIDSFNKLTVTFNKKKKLLGEYKQKARELIGNLASQYKGIDTFDMYKPDRERTFRLYDELLNLVITSLGGYDYKTRTLKILGVTYKNADKYDIKFVGSPNAELQFRGNGYRYFLRCNLADKSMKVERQPA